MNSLSSWVINPVQMNTQTPVVVRAAHPADAASIIEFQVAMAWETEELKLDQETVQKGVSAVFEGTTPEARLGKYFIAECEGQVVGSTLILPEWSDWRNGTVWWIHSVYVKPEFRKRGVFRKIYEHVRTEVQAVPSLRGLRLYVERTNLRAQAVYSRLGMTDEHYALFEWMKTF